jgi:hypothetical protein
MASAVVEIGKLPSAETVHSIHLALQQLTVANVSSGSKPEFTAPQQQRPLRLNERTCRSKL